MVRCDILFSFFAISGFLKTKIRYLTLLRSSTPPPPISTVSSELDAVVVARVDPAGHAALTVDISLRVTALRAMALKNRTQRRRYA